MPAPLRHLHRVVLVAGTAWIAMTAAACQSRPPAQQEATAKVPDPAAPEQPMRMTPQEVREYLPAHPEALLLDVRDSSEWNDDMGHIDGSKMIPLKQLGGRLEEIEGWKDKPIIVISRLGDRGGAGVVALREAGFKQVIGLDGGLEAWRKAGY